MFKGKILKRVREIKGVELFTQSDGPQSAGPGPAASASLGTC